MKNKILKNIGTLVLGAGLSFNSCQDTSKDSIVVPGSIFDPFFETENKIDTLKKIIAENYNQSIEEYDKCVLETNGSRYCINTFLNYFNKSKNALENIIYLLEKNEEWTMQYKDTFGLDELHAVIIPGKRSLSIDEAKNFLENEKEIIILSEKYYKEPTEENNKNLVEKIRETSNLINSFARN